ncbi:TetR family transcriptional regulator [Pendulispora rubella]|uniref:TetR family transcriptional regulator n=1 Tax=Pendulispora rubella TaxID=2741070 RepID=A0ABZ2KQ27_9BACT
MPPNRKPAIAPRKRPTQSRAIQLVADVLEAAIRVLKREGGHRFTTVRVAQEAGVSVGSLYQYFPNKESLLFRLQQDEWEATYAMMHQLLHAPDRTPEQRLRCAVVAFFRTEWDEADLRRALDDAGALFRNAPPAKAFYRKAMQRLAPFFAEMLPRASAAEREHLADFTLTVLASVGEKITERGLSRKEVERWAEETADMLCAHLARVARTPATNVRASIGRRETP